ncbi:MAG: hypothetical protein K2O05_03685 [Anaeroplasmataceae bacterium]|nr:hypothetical protein [Anaeroplasmataceae bacterium]
MEKFKRKIMLEVLIKSLAIGISIGGSLASIIAIICKTCGVDIAVWFYILMGIALAALGSVMFYFILKPNEKEIARRLDKQLNLNEKAITMVEYQESQEQMAVLQREDTKSVLENTSVKKFKMKFHFALLLIPLLAIGLIVSSVIVPLNATATDDPIIDPVYEVDDETIAELLKLIEYIKNAGLSNKEVEDDYIRYIENLIDTLQEEDIKESDKNASVLLTISKISDTSNEKTNYKDLSKVLSNSDLASIRNVGNSVSKLNSDNTLNTLNELRTAVIRFKEEKEANDYLNYLRKDIGNAIKSSNLNQKADLVQAFIELSDKVEDCIGTTGVMDAAYKAMNESIPEILNALEAEALVIQVGDHMISELKRIFNIVEEKPNTPNNGENPDDENNNNDNNPDEEKGSNGGFGGGNTNYAGDDWFFDPDKGLVKYGDVINDYHSVVISLIRDGVIPAEMEDYFVTYFEMLYGKDKNEE